MPTVALLPSSATHSCDRVYFSESRSIWVSSCVSRSKRLRFVVRSDGDRVPAVVAFLKKAADAHDTSRRPGVKSEPAKSLAGAFSTRVQCTAPDSARLAGRLF